MAYGFSGSATGRHPGAVGQKAGALSRWGGQCICKTLKDRTVSTTQEARRGLLKQKGGEMKVYIVLEIISDGYGNTVFSHVEFVFSTLELAQKYVAGHSCLVIIEREVNFIEKELKE